MNTYSFMVSNSSELSLHIVGGYGRDAIPSYRLPLIYNDKYEHLLFIISHKPIRKQV